MHAPPGLIYSIARLSPTHILLPILLIWPAQQTAYAGVDTQQQLSTLRAEIQAAENTLQRSRTDRSDMVKQLKLIDIHISKLTVLIRATDADLDKQQSQLRELNVNKDRLTTQIKQYRLQLAVQLRSTHALGEREYLKILLSSQNPLEFSRMLTYLDYLSRKQLQYIQQAKNSYQELQKTESHIDKRRRILNNDRNRQQNDLRKLNQSKQQRSRVVASLGRKISSKQQKLEALRNNQTRLKQLLHKVMQSKMIQSPENTLPTPKPPPIVFSKLKGKLPRPTSGKVIRKFGQTQTGDLAFNGVIFSTPVGQSVQAVAAGQVVYSDWLRGFGMLLIIDHGKQYMSLYGQNTSLHKVTGDWVESQEVIASTGDSDGMQENGLYFELRYQGKPINPAKWLKH